MRRPSSYRLLAAFTISAVILSQNLYAADKPGPTTAKPAPPKPAKLPEHLIPWSVLTPALKLPTAPTIFTAGQKLKDFGAQLGRACEVAVDVLSGNRAALLSGNSPKLLSGNKPKILSDNTTPIMSGNTFSLFSNIKIEITINNSGNNNTGPGGAKPVGGCTSVGPGPATYAPSTPLYVPPKSEKKMPEDYVRPPIQER